MMRIAKRFLLLAIFFPCAISFPSDIDVADIRPPIAKIVPKIDTTNNDIRVDYYFWLRERDNPEVTKYLEAENSYTEAMMSHTKKLQEKLYQEMLGRIKETDLSVPEKIDDYYYYSRTQKGLQYRIYCRKRETLDATEEILLDQNKIAIGHEYCEIGVYRVSPNHQFLAYSVDTTGDERYTLYIKDLNKNKILNEEIPNTGYSVAWINDNKNIFYTVLDASGRPYKLYQHRMGTNVKRDKLIYQERDDAFFLDISKTKDRAYLMMELGSHTTSEVHYLKADNPEGKFKLFYPRKSKVEYYVEHHKDKFFILTNEDAKNFKLMDVSDAKPEKGNWREIIPEGDSTTLDGIDVFKNHLIVYERKGGLKVIHVINFNNNEQHYIDFPEPVYTYWRARNPEFNTNLLRFNYTSLITPRSVFDYNMDTKKMELKKQYEVLGEYNPSLYESERICANAKDGTKVPISLVYKKGINKDGSNPMFLCGYGAYGSSFEPYFSSSRLSLLDRGFIYAIAHVRGGGELGRDWWEGGKLLHKKNTFTDFIDCAEHLISEGYTSPAHLVISGGSAGGLLIGAVTNMRPELFKAVIADVPFVDVLATMLDPSLPLTVIEYEEWGNPRDKKYYSYIKSYSPYDQIVPQRYPNILITASLNDTRVSYWEAAKFAAKLRALKTDKNILLLKMNMGAGHGGSSGRYDYLKDLAFEYAFILNLF